MKRYLPFVIIAVVLGVAIGAGTWMFQSAQPAPPPPTPTPAVAANPATTPAAAVPKAVVVIEEYGDYQCPPCGMLHPVINTLKKEFGSRMQLNFHHLPLTMIHKNAQVAAQAAEAAKLQGKFWEMHDALYGGQSLWSELDDIRPIVTDYARQLGLNVEQFKKDLEGPRVKAAVFADTQRAEALKIDSTPTILIDGQMIANDNLSLENLRKDLAQRLGLTR
jgi:protein-disulfide isomerase